METSKKIRLLKEIKNILSLIPDYSARYIHAEEAAEKLNIPIELILEGIDGSKAVVKKNVSPEPSIITAEYELIYMLRLYGSRMINGEKTVREFVERTIKKGKIESPLLMKKLRHEYDDELTAIVKHIDKHAYIMSNNEWSDEEVRKIVKQDLSLYAKSYYCKNPVYEDKERNELFIKDITRYIKRTILF